MIRRIDHVGLVVRNLDEAIDLYVDTFGFERSTTTEKAGEFKSVMVTLGEVTLELIASVDPRSGIQKFLETKGEGIHHISLEVDDIRKELESLGSRGIRFIAKEPEQVEETLVSFVHPKSTGHVLIELLQRVQTQKDERPDLGPSRRGEHVHH
jgi:methylmalonyl-CoA/ethylmalonyl-CoA epimerase